MSRFESLLRLRFSGRGNWRQSAKDEAHREFNAFVQAQRDKAAQELVWEVWQRQTWPPGTLNPLKPAAAFLFLWRQPLDAGGLHPQLLCFSAWSLLLASECR